MNRIRAKLAAIRQRIKPRGNATRAKLQRKAKMNALIARRLPLLQIAFFVVGYLWILAIPIIPTGTTDKIDENALLPGQANTHWNWAEVHAADRYLEHLENLRNTNATTEERASYVTTEFSKLGLASSSQSYNFSTVLGDSTGINSYAVLSAPRSPGSEAIIINASWQSRTGEGDGTLNLRGVATVLAFASYARRYSLWAKDLVFVVSDGYLDGMQAWLSAYHGTSQSNLQAEDLELSSGVVWIALSIDYPGHSFSHLGIFHEGLNGRLPNQDLLRSFRRISRNTGGVPVVLYHHSDAAESGSTLGRLDKYLPVWLRQVISSYPNLKRYAYLAGNVLQHGNYQARGIGSGVHALFHQYRIDAFTMFALPASGPHGFHSLGKVLESTLRTANNLLERLHASIFFYVLTSGDYSLMIGNFLPSVILVSVAMMFGGLRLWNEAGWFQIAGEEKQTPRWVRRRRPVLQALALMGLTHVAGAILFWLINTGWIVTHSVNHMLLALLVSATPSVVLFAPRPQSEDEASLSRLLKSLNLCFASTVISAVTVLNFYLAVSLAILLGLPLSVSSSHRPLSAKLLHYGAYAMLGTGWLFFHSEVSKMVSDWQMLGVWLCPVVCMIYTPLVLQAGIVCLLS